MELKPDLNLLRDIQKLQTAANVHRIAQLIGSYNSSIFCFNIGRKNGIKEVKQAKKRLMDFIKNEQKTYKRK